jgi:preprotein translocase subunit SecE
MRQRAARNVVRAAVCVYALALRLRDPHRRFTVVVCQPNRHTAPQTPLTTQSELLTSDEAQRIAELRRATRAAPDPPKSSGNLVQGALDEAQLISWPKPGKASFFVFCFFLREGIPVCMCRGQLPFCRGRNTPGQGRLCVVVFAHTKTHSLTTINATPLIRMYAQALLDTLLVLAIVAGTGAALFGVNVALTDAFNWWYSH